MGSFKGSLCLFFLFSALFISTTARAKGERKERWVHWDRANGQKRWVDRARDPAQALRLLLTYLEQAPTGRRLLAKAHKKARRLGKTLTDFVEGGKRSLTDITLVRHFHPKDWNRFEPRVRFQVRIDRELTMLEAALDLAHELTHFIEREVFNPYSLKFSARQFMAHTIEGKGGEVEAYIAECMVLDELAGSKEAIQAKCPKIRLPNGRYSPSKAAQLFYRVGQSYDTVKAALGFLGVSEKSVPLISPRHPAFISSAHEAPYPLAALSEYVSIMEKACRNDRRRLGLMEKKMREGPNPGEENLAEDLRRFKRSYFLRCSKADLFQLRDILGDRVVKGRALVYTAFRL
ncbi:MAG: hypothetical protein OXB88_04710 [Bacteriovoracales bacterium]|nr:hypothetical protein [Bacteriovoracales bacterium]